jgi:hypothetical protein
MKLQQSNIFPGFQPVEFIVAGVGLPAIALVKIVDQFGAPPSRLEPSRGK